MPLKLITAPTVEPLTAAEAKAHCRVTISDDDTLIGNLITAARLYAEAVCRRAFIAQTCELYLDTWPKASAIEIPLPPLSSVTSVKYIDADGQETTLASSAYIVDTVTEPGRVVLKEGQSWPGVTLRAVNGVIVRFVAGGADAAAVPKHIKQALLLLIGHWYENRETIVVGSITKEIEFSVNALLGLERVFKF